MSVIQEIIAEALDIDIPAPRQGKKRDLQVAMVRDLNGRDLAMLKAGGAGIKSTPVLALRNSHHSVARMLAEGKRNFEISQITGYTPGRISVLQADPAFAELVSYYKMQVEEVYVDFHSRLASLSTDVLETIQERIETAPEKFSNQELRELLKLGADRTGFGPSSKVQHNHAHFSEDILSAIKTEAAARSRSTVKNLELTAQKDSGPPGSGT